MADRRLEKTDLPDFSGEPKEWPEFAAKVRAALFANELQPLFGALSDENNGNTVAALQNLPRLAASSPKCLMASRKPIPTRAITPWKNP